MLLSLPFLFSHVPVIPPVVTRRAGQVGPQSLVCHVETLGVLMMQRGRSKTRVYAWPFVVCYTERKRFSFANAVSFLVSKTLPVNVSLQEGYTFGLFKSVVTQTCSYKFLGGYGCACMYQFK